MSWTDERVELLKAMWTEGKSASQIAKELGGVTRNAVIGKVHRLGLSNRVGNEQTAETSEAPAEPAQTAKSTASDAPESSTSRAETPSQDSDTSMPSPDPSNGSLKNGSDVSGRSQPSGIQPAMNRPIRPVNGHPLPPQPAGAEMSEETLANLAEAAKRAKRLTLMQLTERTCKWPVGDPATDDFWFCGLPAVPGKPYCETHVSVAFQPMSSRRDRRSSGSK
ncbi:MAG: GcrA family cell cycle regulator [Pseudomonadota bacterium]